MKGKDPRDAHFITSRIYGICGDNHAKCACYAQNMVFGLRPPALAEWIINLGEAAEYMFDHNIFQDNLVGVDFCETMAKETNPGAWDKAQSTPSPNEGHDCAESIYRNVLSRNARHEPLTREMFCLMEGRHVHPSTLYPGGVGTIATMPSVTNILRPHFREGKIANYHPYPPTPWNANPRDVYGTPKPYEDAVQNTPIFEENGPDNFKGIDIMRTVRSFDPCLPCGVHMLVGDGKIIEVKHSPMFGAAGHE